MASLKTNANLRASLPEGFEEPEGLVAVAVFEDYPDANDAGLAILAMGGAYWMIYAEPVYVMCVHEDLAEAASKELNAYWALQVSRPFVYREWPLLGVTGWSFLTYLLVQSFLYAGQSRWNLIEPGRMDALLVVERWQVWRGVTALSLHADVVHLLSNLVAGIGFTLLVCRLFGAGLGWLLVLLAGLLGNLATALVYYPESHLAIGASTAVFGALGVLTASGVWMTLNQRELKLSLPQWMLPLAGGFVLLGLLGVGEGPIDVLGHFNGFLFGGLLGFGASAIRLKLLPFQRLCAFVTLTLLFLAWGCALVFGPIQSALP